MVRGRARALSPRGHDHALRALLHASAAGHRARRPLAPIAQLAVAEARPGVAGLGLDGDIALRATIGGLRHDGACPLLLAALALGAAHAEVAPLGHHAIHEALVLAALLLHGQRRALDAVLVRLRDDAAGERLKASTLVWIIVRASVVALDSALTGGPIFRVAVRDGLRR